MRQLATALAMIKGMHNAMTPDDIGAHLLEAIYLNGQEMMEAFNCVEVAWKVGDAEGEEYVDVIVWDAMVLGFATHRLYGDVQVRFRTFGVAEKGTII